jgi:hypothetical protein
MDVGTGLIAIGAGLAVGLAALGTGYAQSRIGAAAMAAITLALGATYSRNQSRRRSTMIWSPDWTVHRTRHGRQVLT